MNFPTTTKNQDFANDFIDSSLDDANFYEFFDYKNKNLYNNLLSLPEKKLFEIEIKQNNNYNINLEFLPKQIDKNDNKKEIKFISKKELDMENIKENKNNYIYRKDAYYKHFKSLFAKYIKNKANRLKNICFPYFNQNNFFAISYKYTGNPKEKDNLQFLSFSVKDLLSYGKDKKIKNRQYYNEQLIQYIEQNESNSKNNIIYMELINFLNDTIENQLINFYQENKTIKNDSKCLFFDQHFKSETNISLIEKNGYLKILKKQY